MLELVPIRNESCTTRGHTRKAPGAFNNELVSPYDGTDSVKIYPATSGYQVHNIKSTSRKVKKTRRPSNSTISSQKIIAFLGGVTLLLVIAITVKSFQSEQAKSGITTARFVSK